MERLFDENQSDKPIRLLGVSVANLINKEDNIRQISIFDNKEELTREEAVSKMLKGLNEHYGNAIIQKGVKSTDANTDKH